MDIARAYKSDRTLKSLTGLSKKEFDALVLQFACLIREFFAKKKRRRAIGGGRIGALNGAKEKLFFILFYLKVYPTYDLAGFFFGTDRCQPCRWVKHLLPILEKVLDRNFVLPKRKISTVEEFLNHFPEVKDIFIDGTERYRQRSRSSKKQKKNYSGKKKAHTRKNIVGTDAKKRVLFVSPSKGGRRHDKHLLDKAGWLSGIPPGTTLWVDTGFQGIEHNLDKNVEIMRPEKRKKGESLSLVQKQNNKAISSLRMIVENAIGGIKRFGALTQLYRNKNGQDDKFFLIAAALWNFHLLLS